MKLERYVETMNIQVIGKCIVLSEGTNQSLLKVRNRRSRGKKEENKKQKYKSQMEKDAAVKNSKSLPQCSTIKELRERFADIDFKKLPPCTQKSFYLTGKIVDKTNT